MKEIASVIYYNTRINYQYFKDPYKILKLYFGNLNAENFKFFKKNFDRKLIPIKKQYEDFKIAKKIKPLSKILISHLFIKLSNWDINDFCKILTELEFYNKFGLHKVDIYSRLKLYVGRMKEKLLFDKIKGDINKKIDFYRQKYKVSWEENFKKNHKIKSLRRKDRNISYFFLNKF